MNPAKCCGKVPMIDPLTGYATGKGFKVICLKCGSEGEPMETKEQAIEAWNKVRR